MIFTKKNYIFTKLITKIKSDAIILYLCYKDIRTPFSAKLISFMALALLFSPIDLIPDFIPVFGYLDDMIIIPLLMYIAFKLIPETVILENREKAEIFNYKDKPVFKKTVFLIAAIWFIFFLIVFFQICKFLCFNI